MDDGDESLTGDLGYDQLDVDPVEQSYAFIMTLCILCLQTDGGSNSQEHVLQSFLHSRWKLDPGVVCDRCNSATSALDGDLKRFLTATLPHLPERPLFGRGTALVRIDERWWAIRVRDPSFERYLPPQLVFLADGTALLWAEKQSETDAMLRELAAQVEVEIQVPFGLENAVQDQPILLRSRRRKYVFLCDSELFRQVSAGGLPERIRNPTCTVVSGLRERLDHHGGHLRGVLPVNIQHVHRALMKVGLNFVAHVVGLSAAQSNIFFRARRFVLNNAWSETCLLDTKSLRAASRQGPPVPVAVAEQIFSKSGDEASRLAEVVVQPGKHVLVLGATSVGLFLYLSLFGEPVARVPLFPDVPFANLRGILALAVVDPENPENDEIGRLPHNKRAEVRDLFHLWARRIPSNLMEFPDRDFTPSPSLPFRFEWLYNRHPALPPR